MRWSPNSTGPPPPAESLDLQTSTSTPSGSFSFVFSGVGETEQGFLPAAFGGVFYRDGRDARRNLGHQLWQRLGAAILPGTVSPNNPLSASLSTPDSFGRGTFNSTTGLSASLNYYVVGPQVIRIIDVDSLSHDTAVGSAYGRELSRASRSAPSGTLCSPCRMSSTVTPRSASLLPSPGTFSGVADLNELLGA